MGELRRMVLDADGLPLDVGREKRVVPPHIRRAVERRDRAPTTPRSASAHCCSGAVTRWSRHDGDVRLSSACSEGVPETPDGEVPRAARRSDRDDSAHDQEDT